MGIEVHAIAKLAIDASVMELDLFVCIGITTIRQTVIEWLGVNVYADSAAGKRVQDLVDRLLEFDLSCKTIRKFKGIGFAQLAEAGGFIDSFNSEILTFEPPYGNRHPAALVAMVMNPRGLTGLPTNGHHLETGILVN